MSIVKINHEVGTGDLDFEGFEIRILKSLRGYLVEQSFQRASSTETIRVGCPANNAMINNIIAGSLE